MLNALRHFDDPERISARELRVMLEHLPQANPVNREFNGPWDDQMVILHSLESGMRRLNANTYNAHRPEKEPPEEPDYIVNPNDAFFEESEEDQQKRIEEQSRVKMEQDHLLAIFAKNNKKHHGI